MNLSRAIILALSQMLEARFRKVMIKAILLSAVTFAILYWAVTAAIGTFVMTDWDWLNWIVSWAISIGLGILPFMLFPLAAQAFAGLYLDDIAEAVEHRHYSGDPPGKPLPLDRALIDSLVFTLRAIFINLLALPAYLVGLLFPPIAIMLYYGLNGYLLSREYFEQIAVRYESAASVAALRKRYFAQTMLGGMLIAFTLTVPVINLAVPVFAAAMMTHMYKRLRRDENARQGLPDNPAEPARQSVSE